MNRELNHKRAAIIDLSIASALLAFIALGVTLGWGIDRLWASFIALPLVASQGITHTYLLGKARR